MLKKTIFGCLTVTLLVTMITIYSAPTDTTHISEQTTGKQTPGFKPLTMPKPTPTHQQTTTTTPATTTTSTSAPVSTTDHSAEPAKKQCFVGYKGLNYSRHDHKCPVMVEMEGWKDLGSTIKELKDQHKLETYFNDFIATEITWSSIRPFRVIEAMKFFDDIVAVNITTDSCKKFEESLTTLMAIDSVVQKRKAIVEHLKTKFSEVSVVAGVDDDWILARNMAEDYIRKYEIRASLIRYAELNIQLCRATKRSCTVLSTKLHILRNNIDIKSIEMTGKAAETLFEICDCKDSMTLKESEDCLISNGEAHDNLEKQYQMLLKESVSRNSRAAHPKVRARSQLPTEPSTDGVHHPWDNATWHKVELADMGYKSTTFSCEGWTFEEVSSTDDGPEKNCTRYAIKFHNDNNFGVWGFYGDKCGSFDMANVMPCCIAELISEVQKTEINWVCHYVTCKPHIYGKINVLCPKRMTFTKARTDAEKLAISPYWTGWHIFNLVIGITVLIVAWYLGGWQMALVLFCAMRIGMDVSAIECRSDVLPLTPSASYSGTDATHSIIGTVYEGSCFTAGDVTIRVSKIKTIADYYTMGSYAGNYTWDTRCNYGCPGGAGSSICTAAVLGYDKVKLSACIKRCTTKPNYMLSGDACMIPGEVSMDHQICAIFESVLNISRINLGSLRNQVVFELLGSNGKTESYPIEVGTTSVDEQGLSVSTISATHVSLPTYIIKSSNVMHDVWLQSDDPSLEDCCKLTKGDTRWSFASDTCPGIKVFQDGANYGYDLPESWFTYLVKRNSVIPLYAGIHSPDGLASDYTFDAPSAMIVMTSRLRIDYTNLLSCKFETAQVSILTPGIANGLAISRVKVVLGGVEHECKVLVSTQDCHLVTPSVVSVIQGAFELNITCGMILERRLTIRGKDSSVDLAIDGLNRNVALWLNRWIDTLYVKADGFGLVNATKFALNGIDSAVNKVENWFSFSFAVIWWYIGTGLMAIFLVGCAMEQRFELMAVVAVVAVISAYLLKPAVAASLGVVSSTAVVITVAGSKLPHDCFLIQCALYMVVAFYANVIIIDLISFVRVNAGVIAQVKDNLRSDFETILIRSDFIINIIVYSLAMFEFGIAGMILISILKDPRSLLRAYRLFFEGDMFPSHSSNWYMSSLIARAWWKTSQADQTYRLPTCNALSTDPADYPKCYYEKLSHVRGEGTVKVAEIEKKIPTLVLGNNKLEIDGHHFYVYVFNVEQKKWATAGHVISKRKNGKDVYVSNGAEIPTTWSKESIIRYPGNSLARGDSGRVVEFEGKTWMHVGKLSVKGKEISGYSLTPNWSNSARNKLDAFRLFQANPNDDGVQNYLKAQEKAQAKAEKAVELKEKVKEVIKAAEEAPKAEISHPTKKKIVKQAAPSGIISEMLSSVGLLSKPETKVVLPKPSKDEAPKPQRKSRRDSVKQPGLAARVLSLTDLTSIGKQRSQSVDSRVNTAPGNKSKRYRAPRSDKGKRSESVDTQRNVITHGGGVVDVRNIDKIYQIRNDLNKKPEDIGMARLRRLEYNAASHLMPARVAIDWKKAQPTGKPIVPIPFKNDMKTSIRIWYDETYQKPEFHQFWVDALTTDYTGAKHGKQNLAWFMKQCEILKHKEVVKKQNQQTRVSALKSGKPAKMIMVKGPHGVEYGTLVIDDAAAKVNHFARTNAAARASALRNCHSWDRIYHTKQNCFFVKGRWSKAVSGNEYKTVRSGRKIDAKVFEGKTKEQLYEIFDREMGLNAHDLTESDMRKFIRTCSKKQNGQHRTGFSIVLILRKPKDTLLQ